MNATKIAGQIIAGVVLGCATIVICAVTISIVKAVL